MRSALGGNKEIMQFLCGRFYMIKYLQRMRAKKGFTIIELVVVIAIIGVLIAIIVPNLSNDSAKAQAADTNATTFYSAVQYCFTKYTKYEADLSLDIKADTSSMEYISYFPSANGNFPINKVTYIEMNTDTDGQVQYVHVAKSLGDLLTDSSSTNTNVFAGILAKDIQNVFHSEEEGYYFAYVYFEDAATSLTTTSNTVRVEMTHYSAEDIPAPASPSFDAAYATNNLMFSDYGKLSCGVICGTCSSAQTSTGAYMGDIGTYFMNKGDEV